MDWTRVGIVTHFFDRIGVAAIELNDELGLGDWIAFVRGDELLFEQEVTSMQIDRQDVEYANAGENVGLRVADKVKPGIEVYRRVQ